MTVLYCDITGNEIVNGTTSCAWRVRNRRFTQIRGRELSLGGISRLEEEINKEMSKRDRFSFKEYKQTLTQKLAELTE